MLNPCIGASRSLNDYKMEPSKQQQLILDHDGCAVVIAAPGSGKTFVLSNKIKLNLKSLMEHQGIIAISYTNKASNELKSRSLSKGENPCSSFFGTIDKFSISELVIPFGKHLFGIPGLDIRVITAKELPQQWPDQLSQVELPDKSNPDFIKLLGGLFRDGIIILEYVGLLASYIFSQSKACREYLKARYTHIYIDEYQDSGKDQHDLFLKIKGLGVKAVAVGDLNQSIYEFSGKDSKYLEALTLNDDFKYFKLDKNHRCAPGIINYSNYLLNPKTELIEDDQRPVVVKTVEGNTREIARWIDQAIEPIKQKFNVIENNKIAILCRYNRTAEAINKELSTPHRYTESNELDKSMNIWASIFSGLLNYVFDENYRFIDIVELFTDYDRFSRLELRRIQELKAAIEEFRGAALEDMIGLKDVFYEIAKLIAPNSLHQDSIILLDEVLRDPQLLLNYYPTGADEINILNLHRSKGLEYDMVIHLDLHEWAFPRKLPGPGKDFSNPVFDNWQQDLNLHYVGITRAKKACILLSSTKRMNHDQQPKQGKPSEFLTLNDIVKLRYIPKKGKEEDKKKSG